MTWPKLCNWEVSYIAWVWCQDYLAQKLVLLVRCCTAYFSSFFQTDLASQIVSSNKDSSGLRRQGEETEMWILSDLAAPKKPGPGAGRGGRTGAVTSWELWLENRPPQSCKPRPGLPPARPCEPRQAAGALKQQASGTMYTQVDFLLCKIPTGILITNFMCGAVLNTFHVLTHWFPKLAS